MADTEGLVELVIAIVSACSTLACLLALFELFYFKLHKLFSYRLIMYILTTLALSSLMSTLLPLFLYGISPERINPSVAVKTFAYLHTSFYCTSLTLVVITTKHFHYMAVDLEYCRGLFIEIGCLLFSVLFPQCFVWISYSEFYSILSHFNPWLASKNPIMFCFPVLDPFLGIEAVFVMSLAIILISIAVLWIMGKRTRPDAVIPMLKHNQALKETLTLVSFFLIFATHSVLLFLTTIASTAVPGVTTYFVPLQAVVGIIGASIGLTGTLFFFLHLCILGKEKRQRLRDLGRGRRRELNVGVQGRQKHAVTYGSTVVMPSRWSAYTTAGYYTGSCNTDFPHVDEGDVDGGGPQ